MRHGRDASGMRRRLLNLLTVPSLLLCVGGKKKATLMRQSLSHYK
jgi:hypothetical protein